ncbi:hypothetical protein C0J56_02090 [Pseudomonas fluorescens]|nr:hypothetical protein C0J56_02090 [Pseudomonas fluorescens]
MRSASRHYMCLVYRIREQARSHIGFWCFLGQLSHSPKWAFFLQRGAGILGRPFPWCRPPLCFAS